MTETEVIAESSAVAALNFDFLFVRLNDNAHQSTGMKKWCGGNQGKTYPNGAPYHHNGNGVSGKHFYLRLFWMDPVAWNPVFIGNYIERMNVREISFYTVAGGSGSSTASGLPTTRSEAAVG